MGPGLKAIPATSPAVDGVELLDEIVALIRRYVSLRMEEADAIALWVVHTWAIDAAYFTPYLSITSAVSESGKSTLLRILEQIVRRPWKTGRVSPAVLVRKIDSERPTLLLDETDAAFGSNRNYSETLRGVLNDGFSRGGTYSVICGRATCDYDVFGPKALAGIGRLPDTVASRSIYIRLRRLAKDEQVAELETWELERMSTPLRVQAERWAEAHTSTLSVARSEMPESLSSRARDVWKPLAAIADAAGDDWPQRAREAAVKLSERRQQVAELDETRALALIREAFDRAGADRLSTLELARTLAAAELIAPERASSEQAAGHALKRALSPFEISPAQRFRFGVHRQRGYARTQFEDAWGRYL